MTPMTANSQAIFREIGVWILDASFESNFQAALDSTELALDAFVIFLADRADGTEDLILDQLHATA